MNRLILKITAMKKQFLTIMAAVFGFCLALPSCQTDDDGGDDNDNTFVWNSVFVPGDLNKKSPAAVYTGNYDNSSSSQGFKEEGVYAIYLFEDGTFAETYKGVYTNTNTNVKTPIEKGVWRGSYVKVSGDYSNGDFTILINQQWDSDINDWSSLAATGTVNLKISAGKFKLEGISFTKQNAGSSANIPTGPNAPFGGTTWYAGDKTGSYIEWIFDNDGGATYIVYSYGTELSNNSGYAYKVEKSGDSYTATITYDGVLQGTLAVTDISATSATFTNNKGMTGTYYKLGATDENANGDQQGGPGSLSGGTYSWTKDDYTDSISFTDNAFTYTATYSTPDHEARTITGTYTVSGNSAELVMGDLNLDIIGTTFATISTTDNWASFSMNGAQFVRQ